MHATFRDRRFPSTWMACALVAVLTATGISRGQPPGGQAPAPRAAAAPPLATPAIGEVGPEIFYLEGDGGRLVPVPGFRYRDFLELFRIREGLPGAAQPPAAVLESLVVRLDARAADRGERTTCPVRVACTVRQTRGGWVHVPIDLDGLFITAPPEHEGPGRLVIDTDATAPVANSRGRGGYRLWFEAPLPAGGDARHEVVLEGRVAAEPDADGVAVGLRMPPATTSLLVVTTDDGRFVTVAPAPPPQRVTTTPGDDGLQTEIAGLAGPLRIRVAGTVAAAVARTAVPQAAVESLVRIDGHNAFIDANIRLENLPADMRRVRVTLPPRTTLRNVRGSTTVAARGGTPERPTIDLAVDRDADGRATIELDCERPIDPSSRGPIELVGFAVAEVPPWRQWGRVSLVVEGDWRAEWPAETGVRRVDPPAGARRPGFVAAFAYDAQPASLPLVVRPRPSRVVIEPEYRYHVGPRRIGMVARFRMSVRGAPVTSLVVALAEVAAGSEARAEDVWVIEDVGPAALVDSVAVTVADGRITIPFLQAVAGEAVVELRASRRIARTAEDLSWSLPEPRADLVVPAAVAITSDSDIEVVPDMIRSRGLVRQAAAAAARNESDVEAGGLLYRLDATQGRFSGVRRSLPRRIDAVLAVEADVDDREIAVQQSIRLTVVHVPLDAVELLVPEAIAAGGTLEVRQDDVLLEPLEDRRDPDASAAAETAGSRLFRVFPPNPILGRGELVVRYRLPTPLIRPESTEALPLPFVLPANARIDRQTLVVESTDALFVDVPDEAWRRDVGRDEGARAWVAAKRQEGARLAIAARPRVATGGMTVEAAWLRTNLLVDQREDIFTYALAGAGERVVVTVPGWEGDPAARRCEILLDAEPLAVVVTADGGFSAELPRTAGNRRRLEIRVSGPRSVAAWERWAGILRLPTPVRLAAPAFGPRMAQRRFYWEISSRADEHLLARPGLWTSQQRWTWSPTGFRSEPVVTTADLAEWLDQAVAGSTAPAASAVVPPVVERRSVFSGVGSPGDHRLWLVPSWCLVLACSGTALAVGLALAYRPPLRRPGVVVPFLAALVLAAAAAPGFAPLVMQAAVPGVLLVMLAWFLRAVFDRSAPGIDLLPDEVAVSATTLTRELSGPPSLVVSPSSVSSGEAAGTSGRSAS